MKEFKVISILMIVAFVCYWIWRWYKLVTSETWQGYLAIFITVGVLALAYWLFGKWSEWSYAQQQEIANQRSAQRKAEYEKGLQEDRELAAKYDPKKDPYLIRLRAQHKKIYDEIDEVRVSCGQPTQAEEAAQKEAERIRQREARLQLLRDNEAKGRDVCWVCETIDPRRCDYYSCDNCMNCDNDYSQYCSDCRSSTYCGDPTCNGYCYMCDDDDDD
ncbi:hypothetical protein HON36_03585 [Candidatus Parcubacteria bacterium]|jgi:hypothetical protein|nr:hypothetical protein [Candidatus Parcubacteria bacterium]MBT7227891.1 hypothetical protein [Candidatus Parcubacteria bacterium]